MRKRADANQAGIVAALQAIGAVVVDLSQTGHGTPDLLVGYRGVNYLLEVKHPDRATRYTPAQFFFNETWRGQRATVTSADQALAVVQFRNG